jgi:hypothetical protein
VICLTEHHLTDSEMDASHIPKYKLGQVTVGRNKKMGGMHTKTSLL